MRLNPGTRVGRYEIVELIGAGGMGVVYAAEDLRLRRTVALKFLNEGLVDAAEARTRFLYEAQAAALIKHPNVCPIYGFEEVDGHAFIVMEFVKGPSLASLLRSGGVGLREALQLAIEIGEGLKAAHARQVVHRDIKPDNILIATDGQVRITDFGLALLAERARITKPGVIMGTPPYFSPEQALARTVDRRSDIWSLGVVLYEMITGSRPFEGEGLRATLPSVILDPVPELHRGEEPLPSSLGRIVGKALAKNPDERYQHTDDFVVDLRVVLRGLPAVPETGLPHSTPVGGGGGPLAPTQTLVAPKVGHSALQSPLRAALRFIRARRVRVR